MSRIVKSISLPYSEEKVFREAQQRILNATGMPIINDSEVLRIGLQAILELDRRKLAECAERCPQQTPGRKAYKEREQLSGDEIKDFFKV